MAKLASLLLLFATGAYSAVLTTNTHHIKQPNSAGLTTNTRNALAPRWDSPVPYGIPIVRCTVPNTVALTFDDGPWIFTEELLNMLQEAGIRATFFVNGEHPGRSIWDRQGLVQRMVAEGHQIGSHTLSHADLSTLDRPGIESQMSLLDDTLRQMLGHAPTYMRPPYFAHTPFVDQTLGELGYHSVFADVDSKDYEHDAPDAIWASVGKFRAEMDAGGSIVLAHDVHEWTVRTLVGEMIREIQARGLTAVPVGECLGDPNENWYR